jgi:putative acetyltransferase
MSEFDLERADPREPDISALLATHHAFSNEQSPPEHVHALDHDGLASAAVSFYSLRDGGELLAVGALREIDAGHGEIKSMHTAGTARGRGIGRLMLNHLLDVARGRGYSRVSLETGTMEAFAPARRLYESVGFEVTPPFGPYWENEYSICMTLELSGV